MQNVLKFKRGDIVFNEGDPAESLFIVQSGRVMLSKGQGKSKIELVEVGASQVFGEQAIFGGARRLFTAEVITPANVIEVPAAIVKGQAENAPNILKIIIKSQLDKNKKLIADIKGLKMNEDSSPCPQTSIPRLFAILFHVGRHVGTPQEDGRVKLSWSSLKAQTNKMFLESPQRMRSCVDLISKLGYAEIVMGESEEGTVELDHILIKDIQVFEDFAEFYQFNLYKGRRSEIMFADPYCLNIAKGLVVASEEEEPDHRGAVTLELEELTKRIKEKTKFEFKLDHIDFLANKGLFINRIPKEEGVFLAFDKAEFKSISTFWEIIHEIDKWNEAGFVDFEETPEEVEIDTGICPSCNAGIEENQNFCGQCGHSLKAA